MAFGSRTEIGWVDAFTAGKYQVQNYIIYEIDNENRRLRVIVSRQRCRSISSAYSYNASTNNGYQLLGGTKGDYSKIYDAYDWLTCNSTAWGYCPANRDALIDCIYSYNADGSVPDVRLATQMIFTLSGYNATYYGFPQTDWKEQNIKGLFPSISAAVTPVTNPSISDVKVNGATLNFVGSSKAAKYQLVLTSGDNSQTITTTNNIYTFTNLANNTTYTCTITAIDADGNKADAVSIQFTTEKQAHVYYNVNGTKKKGYVWVNVGGAKKKALRIWVNVDGTAKEAV